MQFLSRPGPQCPRLRPVSASGQTLRRLFSLSVLLATGSLASAQPATRAVDITDAAGFAQPLAAAIVQIPAHWQSRGGVQWNRRTNCIANQLRFEWSAASPDGLQVFELMPGYSWQVQGTQISMNPCPVQALDSARAFLNVVVQQRRPGARVLDYRTLPTGPEQRTAQGRTWQDAGEMLVAYQVNGVAFRESFKTYLNFSEMQGNVVGGTSIVYAQRAPSGQLDFALGQRIAASMRINPHWQALMQDSTMAAERQFSQGQSQAISSWHAGEMARINAQGASDRAAIRARTNQEVGQIYSNTNRDTQNTNDNIHRRSLEATGEYNTYSGQNGEPVRSSIHGGDRVLQNPNGSAFSTNDPYLNPPGSQELQRVR